MSKQEQSTTSTTNWLEALKWVNEKKKVYVALPKGYPIGTFVGHRRHHNQNYMVICFESRNNRQAQFPIHRVYLYSTNLEEIRQVVGTPVESISKSLEAKIKKNCIPIMSSRLENGKPKTISGVTKITTVDNTPIIKELEIGFFNHKGEVQTYKLVNPEYQSSPIDPDLMKVKSIDGIIAPFDPNINESPDISEGSLIDTVNQIIDDLPEVDIDNDLDLDPIL